MLSESKSRELWKKALRKGTASFNEMMETSRDKDTGTFNTTQTLLEYTVRDNSHHLMSTVAEIMLSEGDVPSYYESAEIGSFSLCEVDGSKRYGAIDFPVNVFNSNFDRSIPNVPYKIGRNNSYSNWIKAENNTKREQCAKLEAEVRELKKPALLVLLWGLIRMLIAPALLLAHIYIDYLTHDSENSMMLVKILLVIAILVTGATVSRKGLGTVLDILGNRLFMSKKDKQEKFDLYNKAKEELVGIDYKYRLARQFEDEWYEAERERLKTISKESI